MANSLDDIWRKIEAERQARAQQQRIAEQRIIEDRERQRREWIERNRIYERFSTISPASSSSAGGGSRFIQEDISNIETLGQSVLFTFVQDDIWKYIIHNFDTDISTEVLSFDLNSNDWYINAQLIVQNKGFVIIFGGEINKSFVIDLSGEIIDQTEYSFNDWGGYSKFAYIAYNENDKYKLLIYDGQVKTLEFDSEINISNSFNGGIILYDNSNYYLVKLGPSRKITTLQPIEESTYISIFVYGFSDIFSLYISDTSNNYLDIKIFNSDGEILTDFNFTSISTTINGISSFSHLNESNSFSFVASDSTNNINYIMYYSYESNSITYNYFSSIDYNINVYNGNTRVDDNAYHYLENSQLFILNSPEYNDNNGLYYFDSTLILPIFKGDTSLRDVYEFTNIGNSRSKGIKFDTIRRYDDNVIITTDMGNSTYDILNITRNSYEYNPTEITLGEISDWYQLKERIIYRHGDSLTFITSEGDSIFGMTASNLNYTINRNTFLFYTDENRSFYTNTQIGSSFSELSYYYTDSEMDNRQSTIGDGMRFGNIICLNYDDNVGQFISDDAISSTFSIILLQPVDIAKTNISVGRDYAIIETSMSDGGFSGISYTHTQAGTSYPMDGVVTSSDSIFGTGSSYFTNMYPGLFVLQADNISLSSFGINGNLGADGSGQTDNYQFEITGTYSSTYSVFVKRVWDAGDPSVNHIIIVNTTSEGIVRDAASNTDSDKDILYNIQNATKIYYLVTSKSSGGFITNVEISDMVTAYLNIIDGQTISNSLSNLNINYTNITDVISESIYNFSDDGSSGSINDGGNDMYDGGNYINPVLNLGDEYIPFLYKVNAINKSGEIVDTLESYSNDLYFNYVYGDRYVGYTGDGIMMFDGTFSTISIGTNEINQELNDYYWWVD